MNKNYSGTFCVHFSPNAHLPEVVSVFLPQDGIEADESTSKDRAGRVDRMVVKMCWGGTLGTGVH